MKNGFNFNFKNSAIFKMPLNCLANILSISWEVSHI